jgi:hypothetical protein
MLTDSILKYCEIPGYLDVIAIRGAKVRNLRQYLAFHHTEINWGQYGLVIVHVGTNNFSNYESPWHVMTEVEGLVEDLLDCKASLDILFSAIIPRPADFPYTNPSIREFNKQLQIYCKDRSYTHFHATYNAFMAYGLPVLAGNSWAVDEIHLSWNGVIKMNKIIYDLICLWKQGVLSFRY